MESHEKEEQKDKKHIGKMIRKNSHITDAYYPWILDDSSKKIIQVKNSTIKLCEERINWYRYPYDIEEWWQENHAA